MKNFVRTGLVLLVAMLFMSMTALAQDKKDVPSKEATKQEAKPATPKYEGIGAGIGMGLSIIGAGLGIGLIGFSALSGIARQPEQAGKIQGAMILLAVLVEGAAIISLVLCLVLLII